MESKASTVTATVSVAAVLAANLATANMPLVKDDVDK
jgi:hypothetical protein